jgi:hypothetical protein
MRMDFILGYYGGAASSKEVMEAIQTAASPEEIVRGVGAYCGAPLNGSIPPHDCDDLGTRQQRCLECRHTGSFGVGKEGCCQTRREGQQVTPPQEPHSLPAMRRSRRSRW